MIDYSNYPEVIIKLTEQYLKNKFNFPALEKFLQESLKNNISAFNSAIACYNQERKTHFESDYPWIWSVNAQEADERFNRDLPNFEIIFNNLSSNKDLAKEVFEHLRDNSYFRTVWLLPPQIFADNLLLLIYRTSVLFLNKSSLFHEKSNSPLVQLSSTIEEMVFCQKYLGQDTPLFHSFKHWLKDWKEEDFAEELYLALKSEI